MQLQFKIASTQVKDPTRLHPSEIEVQCDGSVAMVSFAKVQHP